MPNTIKNEDILESICTLDISKRESRVIEALINSIKSGQFSLEHAVLLIEDEQRYGWMSDMAKEYFYEKCDQMLLIDPIKSNTVEYNHILSDNVRLIPAEIVRQILQNNGIKYKKFADQLGISQNALSSRLSRDNMSIDTFIAMLNEINFKLVVLPASVRIPRDGYEVTAAD